MFRYPDSTSVEIYLTSSSAVTVAESGGDAEAAPSAAPTTTPGRKTRGSAKAAEAAAAAAPASAAGGGGSAASRKLLAGTILPKAVALAASPVVQVHIASSTVMSTSYDASLIVQGAALASLESFFARTLVPSDDKSASGSPFGGVFLTPLFIWIRYYLSACSGCVVFGAAQGSH